MKVLEIIQEAEVNAAPKLGPDGKPLKITNPNEKPKLAPIAGSNWQSTLLSKDSWFLIFYTAHYDKSYKLDKEAIQRSYNKFILTPAADYPISYLRNKMTTMANVSLRGDSPEEIVKGLISSIDKKLGITIGPAWTAETLTKTRPTVKDVELVRDFLTMMGTKIRAEPTTKKPGASSVPGADDTIAPPNTRGERQKIANKLYLALRDKEFADVVAQLRRISTTDDYLAIADFVPTYSTNPTDEKFGLAAMLEDKKDSMEAEELKVIDQELMRLDATDAEGKRLKLDPDAAYNWLDDIVFNTRGNKIDGSSYPDMAKEAARQKEGDELLTKLMEGKKLPQFEPLRIWTQNAGAGEQTNNFNAFSRVLKRQMDKLATANDFITVSQFIAIWNKYYFNAIRRSYKEASQ